MKYCITVFLVLFSLAGISQSSWKCIYKDSAFFRFTDSSLTRFADNMKERNMPEEAIAAVLEKMQASPPYKKRTRYVIAAPDSTIIDMEDSGEGNLSFSTSDEEDVLLKNDELYFESRSGKFDSVFPGPRKVFNLSGRQPVYFNYTCKEYISSDSTCTVWVAEELPSWINPGIRVGGIKGAVLFYGLKTPGLIIRCGINKLEKQDKVPGTK